MSESRYCDDEDYIEPQLDQSEWEEHKGVDDNRRYREYQSDNRSY